MAFLSPALFALLLPLLALPLLLHLMNRGFPQNLKFPSLELIKQSIAERSRLYRWRHWILLLLRTLSMALLLMAFLMPVWKRLGAQPTHKGARHVLIVFDHSVSMENKGDGPTSRERAIHEVTNLIESLDPEDSLNILLMDPVPSTCFVEFSRNHSEAKFFLERLKPGLGHADLDLANTHAARLFTKATSAPEVYFVSDFQRQNWANVDFTAFAASVKLFFVDVGANRRDNRSVLDARIAQAQILAGDMVALEVTIGNFSTEPFSGRVTVQVDQHQSVDQEASIAPWSEGKLTVPLSLNGPGIHLCEVRLPRDALEYDNRFCLTLAAVDKEEVLIVSDTADDEKSSAYFLRTALNPFENATGSILPRVVNSSELSATRFAGVRKAFLSQINRLSDSACAATAEFLFKGGGLIYFLDGPADAENLASLEKTLGGATIPLRLSKRRSATNLASGAQQVARGDFKSRYLKLFQGPSRQNLARMEFYDYYQAGATGVEGILLQYGDDSPAMGVLHHGLGTMLLLNFSASELSSNLARQRLFPAWMQELVKAVSAGEPPPTAYTLGQTLTTEIWRSEMQDFDFKRPSGQPVSVKRELAGERYTVTFVPEQLGFYTLGEPKPLYAFGVNTNPLEADLRPIEKDVLPTEFTADREAHFVSGSDDFSDLANGKPLFHWFIVAATAFLLLESAVQLLLGKRAAS